MNFCVHGGFGLLLAVAVVLLARSAWASDKRVYADYFVSYKSRELSGDSSIWRYYQGDKVAWSGDLYTEPGSNRKQTSTPYYPLIGTYDTLDPAVMEYHILLAKLAGLDGFLCEYALPGGHDGQVAERMAEMGKRYGFQVGIHWVPMNFTTWVNAPDRDTMLAEAKKCLRHALKHIYAVSGAFVQGRPLVLIFNVRAADGPQGQVKGTPFSGRELRALREELPGKAPWLLAWNYHNDPMDEFVDGYYPWVIPSGSPVPPGSRYDAIGSLELQKQRLSEFYRSAQNGVAEGRIQLFMAGVWPGFDDSRGRAWGEDLARYVPREDGRTLSELWAMAKASGSGLVLIETWNDWVESSIIEPSVEWGFRDLEACQREIAEWKGVKADPVSLRLPLRLYQARRTLSDLRNAGLEAERAERMQAQADEAALALSRFKTTEAEGLLLKLEKACAVLDAAFPKQTETIRIDPTAPEVSREHGQVVFACPKAWQEKLAGKFTRGRLRITYQDNAQLWIVVRQSGPLGARELANFQTTGRQGWRAAELDILPGQDLDQTKFVIVMEGAKDRVGEAVFTLEWRSPI